MLNSARTRVSVTPTTVNIELTLTACSLGVLEGDLRGKG